MNRDMRLAWHIETLQRQRVLPPLDKLLVGVKRLEQQQTDDERRGAFDEIRGRFGLSSRRVRLVKRPVVN